MAKRGCPRPVVASRRTRCFAVGNQKLPSLDDFQPDDGLLADILTRDLFVDSAHEDGINAIRVDGSGRFVSRNLFDEALPTSGNSVANNPTIQSIWEYAIKREEQVP